IARPLPPMPATNPAERPAERRALMLRAATPGAVLALAGGLALVALGRLPDETVRAALAGAGLAAITGAIGSALKAAAVAAPPPNVAGALATPAQGNLQLALFGDFALQLFTI